MTLLKAIAAVAALAIPGWAAAQEAAPGPVVVELFTSQGCSSCPPADAMLHHLAARSDVLPLALHVDYWDYIGWADKFADPANTARQKGYAHAAGRSMIYTPQMIVMGRDDVVGADAMEVADAVARYLSAPPLVALQARRAGGQLTVALRPLAALPKQELLIQLVRYAPLQTVTITRGELAGRTLDYANVVEDWQVVQQWDGQAPVELSLPLAGEARAAVLVQQAPFGAVLAAARAD